MVNTRVTRRPEPKRAKLIKDEVEVEHKDEAKPTASGPMTAVGNALPTPIILRVFKKTETTEPTPLNGRTPSVRFDEVERHTVPGYNSNVYRENKPAQGIAYAIHMLPTPFCEEWLKQNHDSSLVEAKVLLFSKKGDKAGEDEAESRAKELLSGKIRSGLEPLNADRLPRAGMVLGNNMIETAEEQRVRPEIVDVL
jgi:hypothetical protein